MKNRTLSLSLVIGAAFTIPSLAIAASADPMPVTAQAESADNTLQNDVENTNVDDDNIENNNVESTHIENATKVTNESEPAPNQLRPIEISETKTFSRSRTSTIAPNTSEAVTPEVAASDVETPELMPAPKSSLEVQEEEVQDTTADMIDTV